MSRALCAVILAISVFAIAAAPAPAQTSGPPYTLTITPPTGGKVQASGINCGAGGTACSVTMPVPLSLGLNATASSGYTFTAWTGDCTGTTASIVLALAGARTCGATFTPVGGGPTTPVITWPTPAPITQGTALSATQLNATTTVLGSFVYTPGAGTVLAAGSYTLTTNFTPSNTTLYTSASKTVTQVVNAPGTPAGVFWVYDANDVVVGQLRGTSTVTFQVGGVNYAAAAGPAGWFQTDVALYFFDAACSDGPYFLHSYSSIGPPQIPEPMPQYFFYGLSIVGSIGYQQTGQYQSRALSAVTPNVWYRVNGAGPCTPLALTAAAWFDAYAVVQLPAHPAPFTIR